MIQWNDVFYFSIISASLLLSILELLIIALVPGISRWNKRFFLCYFILFMLCCVTGLIDLILSYSTGPGTVYYIEMILECMFLSLPLLMPTVYLLHCCGENILRSRLLHAVLGLWTVCFSLLVSALFIDGFTRINADNLYVRGPLYPIMLMPLVAIQLLNLIGTMKRRDRLFHKVYLSLLIVILPMTVALTVQLFVDVYPFIDLCYVLSALAMLYLIQSDQVERERLQEQEIARQQREIARQQANVTILQMRPHFIYNTLMSIYSLCNQDPQKARQVTMDFTDYLRRNFNAVASGNTIPFSAELEHTRAYLAVEQAQHEEMLVVEYDTQFTRFRLPPLTLRPIVENAVKHGMDPYAGPLQFRPAPLSRTKLKSFHERPPVTGVSYFIFKLNLRPSKHDKKPHVLWAEAYINNFNYTFKDRIYIR